MTFSRQSLEINAPAEAERLSSLLVRTVRQEWHRNGAVIGLSGGVDSSVVLALCVRAFGPERVRAIVMPERDSDPESETLAREVASNYGVEPLVENITTALDGFGCHRRRDEAVRWFFPDYDPASGWKVKIALSTDVLAGEMLNVFLLTVIRPDGVALSKPLGPKEFRQVVAASNFKQRTRSAFLYYHAELSNYAVVGTANKNEYDLGFFVKHGDGGVDVQPIAHLFKTQVYQLAEFLGVPEEVRVRPPTTDTYSAPITQEEFFFRLPFSTMDLLWYAMDKGVAVADVARLTDLSEAQVIRAQNDIIRKRRATEYLRLEPIAFGSSAVATTV
ncbi:MAG TPA: NAD(+) synthase [Bryobacteraceae bacterium]|nr:NAD(+) synthase [Bryobacteraceae bacterium]